MLFVLVSSTSTWSQIVEACIKGNNAIVIDVVSDIQECMVLCEQESTIACQSVDYYLPSARCHLAEKKKDDIPLEYYAPCYISGFFYTDISSK